MNYPPTYGAVMRPLDLTQLAQSMQVLLSHRADILAWALLEEKTLAAEKISCPLDWNAEEKAAYESGDTVEFSRRRGYSEDEIDDFMRSMAITSALISEFGEEEVQAMHYEIRKACSTPQLELIDDDLIDRMRRAQGFRDVFPHG